MAEDKIRSVIENGQTHKITAWGLLKPNGKFVQHQVDVMEDDSENVFRGAPKIFAEYADANRANEFRTFRVVPVEVTIKMVIAGKEQMGAYDWIKKENMDILG